MSTRHCESHWGTSLLGSVRINQTQTVGCEGLTQQRKALNFLFFNCNEKESKSLQCRGFTTEEWCPLTDNTQLWRVNFESKETPPPALLFLVTSLWGMAGSEEQKMKLRPGRSWLTTSLHCSFKKRTDRMAQLSQIILFFPQWVRCTLLKKKINLEFLKKKKH